jgi:hypothetical protein
MVASLSLLRTLSPGMLGSGVTDGDHHGGDMSRSQMVTQLVTSQGPEPGPLGHSLPSPMFDSMARLQRGMATSCSSRRRLSAGAVQAEPAGWLRPDWACDTDTSYPFRTSWLPAVARTLAQTSWRLDLADATAHHQAHQRRANGGARRAIPGSCVVNRLPGNARDYRSQAHVW